MIRIAHLSDLHFGREQPRLVDRLLDRVHALGPDLVAISGDLTQRARPRELRAAAGFVRALPPPVLLVPGNHDIPGVTPRRFIDKWRGWRRHLGDELEPVVQQQGLLALGANSVRAWGPYLDWSRGRLREPQVQRLASRLGNAGTGQLRVLVAHHPLLLTPAGAHRGEMAGAGTALPLLAQAGLDLALGGHVHLAYAGVRHGVVVAHAGSTTSDRLVGDANGFNVIEGDREDLRVQQWRWRDREYAPGPAQCFLRDPDGWRPAPD